MSLVMLEAFESNTELFDWNIVVSDLNGFGISTTKRTGTYALNLTTGTERYAYFVHHDTSKYHAHWTCGFGLNISSGNGFNFLALLDTSGSLAIFFKKTSLGELIVYRGDNVELGRTDAGVIHNDTWHYVEVDVILSDTVGEVKLRIDGKTPPGWSDLTNTDTRSAGAQFGGWMFSNGRGVPYGDECNVRIDDMYIVNSDGTAPQGLQGDTRVYKLYPNGNGNYSQLTGSDGNSVDNYLQVDEGDGDPSSADYNGSSTDGNKDTYTFGDLPVATGGVIGVQVNSFAAKTEAGTKACRAIARRAGVDGVGDDRTLQTSYFTHRQHWSADPTDASAWSIAKVNASEFGFEVRP